MATARVLTRTAQPKTTAIPLKASAPPAHPPPPVPGTLDTDTVAAEWAIATTRFSTVSGALTLTRKDVQALKEVPREGPSEDASASVRVTRTRSMISHGQRIDFAFHEGGKHLAGLGVPVYVLATLSEAELNRHMAYSRDEVMSSFNMKQVRIRVQWPFQRDGGLDYISFEEWVKVNASTTRVQLAMLVAAQFRGFLQKHGMPLASLPDYEWLLRPDAFYRVWLVGLERVENNIFAADLRYVKDHPR